MKLFLCLVALLAIGLRAEEHEFKAETNKLLQIIISSLYQSRQVFLREVLSNAADALTKQKNKMLMEHTSDNNVFEIKVSTDDEANTVTLMDTGIGMTKDELQAHLGVLGASGTKKFLETAAADGSASSLNSLIGQFGVGFYSVFLVADNVKVASRPEGEDKQWVWESTGADSYKIYEDPRGVTLERGTEITLQIKEDATSFLKTDELRQHMKQYSEFIDFPIYVQVEKTEKVPKKKEEAAEAEEKPEDEEEEKPEGEEEEEEEAEEEEEFEDVTTYEWELVNEAKPLWMRPSGDIEEDEYNKFYQAISKETEDPLAYTHFSVEGEVEFKSILYIPGKAPFNLFDHTSTMTNVRLYVRRVFITDEFKDLLPRYLNFVKGVVDSDDLPLNVSREVLQESRLLKIIKKKLVRKVLALIGSLADEDKEEDKEEDAEDVKDAEAEAEKEDDENKEDEAAEEEKKEKKYPTFWKEFGKNIRLGLIEDSSNRARLTKLLRYQSTKSGEDYTSLDDYIDRMKENQQGIFFLAGESLEEVKSSILLQRAEAAGVEVLYMTDAIDEYVTGHVTEYSGHKLVNLAKDKATMFEKTNKEKKIEEARTESWKPFADWLKKTLSGKIEKAQVTERLETAPVALVATTYGITGTMQKIMAAQALAQDSQTKQTAKRVLEFNVRHPIVDELRRLVKENEEDTTAKDMAELLYETAALQSNFPVENPNGFAARILKTIGATLNLEENASLVEEEEYEIEEDEEEDEEADAEEDEDEDEPAEDEPAAEEAAKDEL